MRLPIMLFAAIALASTASAQGSAGSERPAASACASTTVGEMPDGPNRFRWNTMNLCDEALKGVWLGFPALFEVAAGETRSGVLTTHKPSIADFRKTNRIVWMYTDDFDAQCAGSDDEAMCVLNHGDAGLTDAPANTSPAQP